MNGHSFADAARRTCPSRLVVDQSPGRPLGGPPCGAAGGRRAARQARSHPARRRPRVRRARLLRRAGGRRGARRRCRRGHRVPLLSRQGRPARLDLRARHERRHRGGTRRARRRRGSARSPAPHRAPAPRAPGPRPQSRRRLSGRAAAVHEVHGAVLDHASCGSISVSSATRSATGRRPDSSAAM